MAYLFPECEFCVHHGHQMFCDECDDGDNFEPAENHAKKKQPPPPTSLTGRVIPISAIADNFNTMKAQNYE